MVKAEPEVYTVKETNGSKQPAKLVQVDTVAESSGITSVPSKSHDSSREMRDPAFDSEENKKSFFKGSRIIKNVTDIFGTLLQN